MKKINFIKRVILDVLFAILLFTAYKKNMISMMYHEVVGLIILGVLIIHLIFNKQWIINQTRKLLSNNNVMHNKALFINDFLLILTFLIIIVTGIFISKKIFHFEGYMWMKQWHYFFAMISLILLGIHFGLHDKFIALIFGNFSFLGKYKKIILYTILIVISIFGLIMLFRGDFARYITMPFKNIGSMKQAGHGAGQGMKNGMGKGMGTGTISIMKVIFMSFQTASIIILFATITKIITNVIRNKKVVKI